MRLMDTVCGLPLSLSAREKIEKSGTDSPFRAGQLRIFKRLRGAKTVSGPGFSIFSQLSARGRGAGETVPALTLGAVCVDTITARRELLCAICSQSRCWLRSYSQRK